MAQDSPTIDRNEIVKIVSNFYTFLTTHSFLPASAIIKPRSEGWPREYREVFYKMGKSHDVVDLLSHLPYINDANWEWLHDTKPINFISPLNLRRISDSYEHKRYLFEPQEQSIPAHVFSLTNGRLYGIWLLLDTQAGTITEYTVLNRPTPKILEEQCASDSIWRLYPTTSCREFFARCQEKMQGRT